MVTVKVSDGRGGVAEGTTKVCVQEPPKPKPEAVTCTSGGFPRNLSRLNNVDKACLDDVASKLNQDPRSRVIIVGHADASERNTEVMGRKRAEAVKGYLVQRAWHRRGPHHGQERGRLQASRHRHERPRPGQEPARGRRLRARGGHGSGGRRLESSPGLVGGARPRGVAPLLFFRRRMAAEDGR